MRAARSRRRSGCAQPALYRTPPNGARGSQTPGRSDAVKLRGQTTSFIIDVNDRGERSELSGAVKNRSQSRSRADGRVYSITNLLIAKAAKAAFSFTLKACQSTAV